MEEVREPAVAGQFYPSEKDEVIKAIEKSFSSRFGPQEMEKEGERKEKVYGVVSAHAGYSFSGPAMAWSYSMLNLDFNPKDVYIILGTDHTGLGHGFSLSQKDFKTPLGIVNNYTDKLDLSNLAEINETAHQYEHSIEVQLPFLQYLYMKNNKSINEINIVPIIVSEGNIKKIKTFSSKIFSIIKKRKLNVKIIASSDFTHYGISYGFTFNTSNIKTEIYKRDMKAVDEIIKLDSSAFLKAAERTTICGKYAIATAIEIVKLLGSKKARLLKYYTTGDLYDYNNNAVVAYGSIGFL